MQYAWWILAAAVAAFPLWFILKAVVGATVSPKVSGKLLLKKELSKYGVDSTKLGDSCLEELTDNTIALAEDLKLITGEGFSTLLVQHIEGTAVNVALYLYEKKKPVTENDPTYQTLKRHGLIQ